MNVRLAAIDAGAQALHDERLRFDRDHGGHMGQSACVRCLELATLVIDGAMPVLVPPTPAEKIVAARIDPPA